MYGTPALPPDFVSLPYANAQAPKGGRIILGNTGGFDSLNPFVRRGTVPWQLRFLTHDSLMARSWDEPFTLYGLLAESVEVPEDRAWVEFTLREEARFSDGSPVTVEDVIWSYETLGTEGHPRYLSLWNQIDRIEATGPRSLRITFAEQNRELALIAGLRPILKKAQWEGQSFADAGLTTLPIGAGPYVIDSYEANRRVTLRRDPDYWGADVPVRRGTHNFDEIVLDFYADGAILFEAFKAGELSALREFDAQAWARDYDFPAAQRGEITKTEITNEKPSGMTGFAMNTRRPPLDDWRVRAALIHAFNFEYINDALTGGVQPRITSYFSGSDLAYAPGPAPEDEAALLAPFAADLPPGTLDGYALPQSDGSASNRRNLRKALKYLADAGFTVEEGVMTAPDGTQLRLELVLNKNNRNDQAIADIYAQGLERLGIALDIQRVDNAQFTARSNGFDFDMISFRRALSLSPGNEQRFYWGSEAATQDGSRNLPGIALPVVDAMIDAMLDATEPEDFTRAVRALDRVLTAGRYVIPFASFDRDRIAHIRQMKHPPTLPIYGDGPEYMPQAWWWED
ncbi:ABC transporter substrate-binding protein [Aliishimia ponticola]|uniref:ABC transporter substrate-binding protein n=2 Tax=Aliishimia ponticola TaxID=2499833 RepID=A0A4S4NHM9_9RHOB|nr:ABC transporter substrate-binding protein [Aliishimia ponticola]